MIKRLSLVPLLCFVATLELIAHRVASKLIHQDLLRPRSLMTHAVDDLGAFVFEFAAVLGVLILAVALARIALYGSDFRRGARWAFPLVGSVFVALAAIAAVATLPPRLLIHLHLSFLFLIVQFTLAVLAAPTLARIKLGSLFSLAAMLLGVLPPLFHWLYGSALGVLGSEVVLHLQFASILVAALFFCPRTPGTLFEPVATAIVTCTAALLMRHDWQTAARIGAYGFGFELPLSVFSQFLILCALAAGLYTTLRLLSTAGTPRLRGYGLLLIGLSGLSPHIAYQLTLAALGFLCLAQSAVRPDRARLSREIFEQLVRHASSLLGAPNATITGEQGFEVARMHAPAAAPPPIELTLTRHDGTLSEIEVRIGEQILRAPPFAVQHRAARKLGALPKSARVLTEDPIFDRVFSAYDQRGAGAPLLDEETRAKLLRLCSGWLAVWPERAVVYRSDVPPTDDAALTDLFGLLKRLAARPTS